MFCLSSDRFKLNPKNILYFCTLIPVRFEYQSFFNYSALYAA